jgi:uncharacterized protein YjiS (DUF1127 family)
MTAHVSKEQLGLMMPGTMDRFFQDEQEYLESPRAGLLARAWAGLSAWYSRQVTVQEIAGLSDMQLADIGISRADVPLVFEPGFIARRDNDRIVAMLQTGRIAGM